MRKRTAMIVEDDPNLREMLGDALVHERYTVEAFDTAEAALIRLRRGPWPGVLVVDDNLPGMSGCELIDSIAASALSEKTVIIRMSGMIGANPLTAGVLYKPFSLGELLDRISAGSTRRQPRSPAWAC